MPSDLSLLFPTENLYQVPVFPDYNLVKQAFLAQDLRLVYGHAAVIAITSKSKSKSLAAKFKDVLDKGAKVLVEGANLIKKHIEPNPQLNHSVEDKWDYLMANFNLALAKDAYREKELFSNFANNRKNAEKGNPYVVSLDSLLPHFEDAYFIYQGQDKTYSCLSAEKKAKFLTELLAGMSPDKCETGIDRYFKECVKRARKDLNQWVLAELFQHRNNIVQRIADEYCAQNGIREGLSIHIVAYMFRLAADKSLAVDTECGVKDAHEDLYSKHIPAMDAYFTKRYLEEFTLYEQEAGANLSHYLILELKNSYAAINDEEVLNFANWDHSPLALSNDDLTKLQAFFKQFFPELEAEKLQADFLTMGDDGFSFFLPRQEEARLKLQDYVTDKLRREHYFLSQEDFKTATDLPELSPMLVLRREELQNFYASLEKLSSRQDLDSSAFWLEHAELLQKHSQLFLQALEQVPEICAFIPPALIDQADYLDSFVKALDQALEAASKEKAKAKEDLYLKALRTLAKIKPAYHYLNLISQRDVSRAMLVTASSTLTAQELLLILEKRERLGLPELPLCNKTALKAFAQGLDNAEWMRLGWPAYQAKLIARQPGLNKPYLLSENYTLYKAKEVLAALPKGDPWFLGFLNFQQQHFSYAQYAQPFTSLSDLLTQAKLSAQIFLELLIQSLSYLFELLQISLSLALFITIWSSWLAMCSPLIYLIFTTVMFLMINLVLDFGLICMSIAFLFMINAGIMGSVLYHLQCYWYDDCYGLNSDLSALQLALVGILAALLTGLLFVFAPKVGVAIAMAISLLFPLPVYLVSSLSWENQQFLSQILLFPFSFSSDFFTKIPPLFFNSSLDLGVAWLQASWAMIIPWFSRSLASLSQACLGSSLDKNLDKEEALRIKIEDSIQRLWELKEESSSQKAALLETIWQQMQARVAQDPLPLSHAFLESYPVSIKGKTMHLTFMQVAEGLRLKGKDFSPAEEGSARYGFFGFKQQSSTAKNFAEFTQGVALPKEAEKEEAFNLSFS